jgi:hypothetical protein
MDLLKFPFKESFQIEVFDNNDEYCFCVNSLDQMYDVRVQIKEEIREKGYYFKYENNKILIDENGRINRDDIKNIPFTRYEQYLDRLL